MKFNFRILVLPVVGVFMFSQLVFAYPDDPKRDDDNKIDRNLNSIDRANGNGFSFGPGSGNFPTPGDFDRQASAGFLAEGNDRESVERSAGEERNGINEQHIKTDEAKTIQQEKIAQLKAQDELNERARKTRLALLDQQKLERDRAASQRAINYFKEMNGPSDKWTPEQNAKYEKLVYENAALNEPTKAEQEKMDQKQQARDQVYNDIKNGAMQMGMMDDQSAIERKNAYEMSNAATKGWRDFTFTGQMVNHMGQDIFNQREKGIRAKSMVISATVYLQNPNLTPDQKQAAQNILDANKLAMANAADAISKDCAVILLGTTADLGMLGVGKAVTKIVGGVKTLIVGGETAGAGTAGATSGTAGATGKAAGMEAGTAAAGKTAGTEAGTAAAGKTAGQEAGTQAGTKAGGEVGQAATDYQKAADEAYKHYGSFDAAGDALIGTDELVTAEASKGAAELQAIKDSVKNLTQSEIDKLFQKGANLTPNQIIQKAELLSNGYRPAGAAAAGGANGATGAGAQGFNPPPGWSEGATVVGNEGGGAAGQATQKFGGVLPTPNGGTTQPFNGAMTLPHPAPVPTAGATGAAGGTTQAFKTVMPIPGGGGATAASEAATVQGNLTGNTTQAFNKVLPTPATAPGVNPGGISSEAATVKGNLTGGIPKK